MKQEYRTGIGYDIHRTDENRKLIIGGVTIPHDKGLLGHSDADVLVHAIIDAMLGALALPDIGTLFPDDKDEFEGISSIHLLELTYKMILEQGYRINNIDSNIIAQAPKMMPYIPKMKKVIAEALNIDINLVSIKARSKEKVDAVGELKAIEANAVVMLVRK